MLGKIQFLSASSPVSLHFVDMAADTISDDEPTLTLPRKRCRLGADTGPQKKTVKEPRLFVPFRALGLVTNHIPFVLQTRSHKGATEGPRLHLLTCLGRAWALWEGGKMGLLFVGVYVSQYVVIH